MSNLKDPGSPTVSRPRRRWLRWLLLYPFLALLALVATTGIYYWWTRPVPRAPVQIFKGITYECRQFPQTAETEGLAHLFTIDLKTPGLQLWVTPEDSAAVARGGLYFTRWFPSVASEQKTSVLINATLFSQIGKDSRLPGVPAKPVETLVSNGKLTNLWMYSRIIWFEDDLTPHTLQAHAKPEQLSKAKWAISGQMFMVENSKISAYADHTKDRRTSLGVSLTEKKLYIGVFDASSTRVAARTLHEMGAEYAVGLDGGTSTGLVIGKGAQHVRSGTYVYPLRAIPTHFGVIAPP